MKIVHILGVALVLVVLVAGPALAGGSPARTRDLFHSGGTVAVSGSMSLRATMGQLVAGVLSSGDGQISLGQGFWHAGLPRYGAYLPLVPRQFP